MSTGSPATALDAPVNPLGPPPTGGVRDETALCLSGGGYRAMLFHVGSLWRLTEAGLLAKLDRVSSVSGGSITAACLALAWKDLKPAEAEAVERFKALVVAPIRKLAGKTIDQWSVLGGILTPGISVSDMVARAYRDHIFGDATLQDLPDTPRFVINATNVQSGALWRFMKPYMRDYLVGEVKDPDVSIALVVAASSAFPPVLSPVRLALDPARFTPGSGLADPHGGPSLQREPFTSEVVLSDGGVYDNLGLETAWKRCRTVLVSDAGAKIAPEGEPAYDWARHSLRVLDLVDNQVRSLRKRQLIASYKQPPGSEDRREGAYWGIRTHIADYGLAETLPCAPDRVRELAQVPTRLQRMEPQLQDRLINWGYAVCDAAIRAHVDPASPRGEFPFPDARV